MSKFTVRLNQAGLQGQLDVYGQATMNPESGPAAVSLQRTVYIMGPDKINYLLNDGDSFVGNNYWLRYVSTAQGGTAVAGQDFLYFADYATDYDGGSYSDNGPNLYTTVLNQAVVAGTPVTINFLGTYGGIAKFLQMSPSGTGITYTINGNTSASLTLANSTTTVYQPGEINWTSITLTNTNGGSDSKTVAMAFSVELNSRISSITGGID